MITALAGRLPFGACINRQTGWAMDIMGGTAAIHTGIQQFPPHGGDNQAFRFTPLPGLYYKIEPLIGESSNLVLDVAGASTSPGATVQLFPWHGGTNQTVRPHLIQRRPLRDHGSA